MNASTTVKTLASVNQAPGLGVMGRVMLVIGFLVILGGAASADFKAGLAAYERNDYAAAFREWLPLAERGDGLAQLYVARMYEEGNGVRRSFGDARRWYDRAAATLPPGEERDRAIRGRGRAALELAKAPVDPGVVGSWRLTMPDPTGGTPQEWLLEINDAGDFWFKITRATASRLETGAFKAKDGKWQWTTRGDEQTGTYRVIDSNSLELTGILGTARWTRVHSMAQQPTDASPKPSLAPQKPGLFPGPKDVPPVLKVPATGTPPSTGGRVLFEDDFRTKRQLLDQAGPFCKTSYGDGGLIVEDVALQGRCRLILSNAGEFRASVRIEVSSRLRRGGQNYGYGLMFGRTQDGRSYYTLTINKDGYYTVSLNQDGKWTPLLDWKQDPAVKLGYGSMNRMAVEVQGRSIRAYINDKHVGVVQAPAEPTGQLGFYLDLLEMETVFSDLRVTELRRAASPAPQISSKLPGPPVTGGRVLFQDDFRNQQWRSGIGECAKSSYGDGGFIVENIHQSGGCGFRLSEAGKFSGNLRIELTAALRKGRQDGGYGLVFGMEEPGRSRFYTFYVTAEGWYCLLANRDSKVLIQWTKHPSVRTGYNASNNLIVEIQDRTIKVLINGIQVGVVQAPAAIVGSIELGTGWPGMEVIFTNVRVNELAAGASYSRQ